MEFTTTSRLTDSELISELTQLAGSERRATVALIVRLAEFDARRLYAAAGFSSTFKYCMQVLRLSEDAAFNRLEAARLARKYPAVLDMLLSGDLSPTTARMLAKHLTPENCEELLKTASGKSKRDVERLLAGRFPQPDVAPFIRKLPEAPHPVVVTAPPVDSESRAQTPPPLAAAAPAPRPEVHPLAEDRYVVRFTADATMHQKLRLAQDLLGHAVPSGDLLAVFDRALTLLIADLQRKTFAAVKRPRRAPSQNKDSRRVPADVRREVVRRDGGCCAFVASDGRRCGERRFLQFHHVHPYWAGGKATVENIQLRCGPHNRYEARVFFDSMHEGAAFMKESAHRRLAPASLNPFQNG